MPTPPLDPRKLARVIEKWNTVSHLSYAEASKQCGVSPKALRYYVKIAGERGLHANSATSPTIASYGKAPLGITREVEIAQLPDDDLDIEEIISHRKKEYAAKKKHEEASRLISINVKISGPIGILHFGDPHVDDDGTDIEAIELHSDLTHKVEGLYGANVGDTTNSWVGGLARLYSQQNCGRKRAIKIAEWFIKRTRWMYMVGGNHDAWAGDDDPIKWISGQSRTLYRSSEARLELRFPAGAPFTINARHDFAGSSIYNPAHGAMKAIHFGVRDELSTCGHKHVSGYGVLKDPVSGKTCHALQVGSYKIFDRFAKEKGFRDQSLGPAALTVIQPTLPITHPDRCKVWWNPLEGADYLTFLRRRKAA